MLIKNTKSLLIISLIVGNVIGSDLSVKKESIELKNSNLKKIALLAAVTGWGVLRFWGVVKLVSSLSKTTQDPSFQTNSFNNESEETILKDQEEKSRLAKEQEAQEKQKKNLEKQIREQVNNNAKSMKEAEDRIKAEINRKQHLAILYDIQELIEKIYNGNIPQNDKMEKKLLGESFNSNKKDFDSDLLDNIEKLIKENEKENQLFYEYKLDNNYGKIIFNETIFIYYINNKDSIIEIEKNDTILDQVQFLYIYGKIKDFKDIEALQTIKQILTNLAKKYGIK